MKKILLSAILLTGFVNAFAQQSNHVDMADEMRSSGRIYVVIATVAIIFIGLAVYLFSMDRRLKKIEKDK